MELNGKKVVRLDLNSEWTLRHQKKAKAILGDHLGELQDKAAQMVFELNFENEVLALIFKYEGETKLDEANYEERKEAFLDVPITEEMRKGVEDFFGMAWKSMLKDFQTYMAKLNPKA